MLVQGERFYAQNVANVQESDVAVARWLAGRLPPDAVLAVNDIGAIKYLLPNRIVDLASIATPEIGREVPRATAAGTPLDRSHDRRPRPPPARLRGDLPLLVPRPRPRPPLPGGLLAAIPDNVTMGGDEIVVYETPWTRHPLRKLPGD